MSSNDRRPRRAVRTAGAGLAALCLAFAGAQPALATDISVGIDEAALLRVDRPAAEVIVGNPAVADVAVQSSSTLVITGKSFGYTNLIALDARGDEIANKKVRVISDGDRLVTLHKGRDRHSYDCLERCETALIPGDVETYYEPLAKGVRNKLGIAQSIIEGGQATQ